MEYICPNCERYYSICKCRSEFKEDEPYVENTVFRYNTRENVGSSEVQFKESNGRISTSFQIPNQAPGSSSTEEIGDIYKSISAQSQAMRKAIEECSELITVLAKKQSYLLTDEHPDGKGSLKTRMEEEIADVRACLVMLSIAFDLKEVDIIRRIEAKIKLYSIWLKEDK